jgi:hypothetical protein
MPIVGPRQDTRLVLVELSEYIASQLKLGCNFVSPSGSRCSAQLSQTGEDASDGYVMKVDVSCRQGHIGTISNTTGEKVGQVGCPKNVNSPDLRTGHHALNVRAVIAHTIASHGYTSTSLSDTILMGHHMYPGQWNNLQSKIWEATTLVFKDSATRVQNMLKDTKEYSTVSDMGWLTRGWTARHGSLPIMWYEQKLIIMHPVLSDITREGKITIPGNYSGSSGGMESCALQQCIQHLESIGVLRLCKNIIMDKDSSATKTIRGLSICNHISIRYDPGHVKKSLGKKK